ncbi:MAG: transposase [Chloroflexales bacterium]
MKKTYTSAFKAQVALELLKEEKTLAQLSSAHGVGTTVLCEWRAIARKGLASLYERRDNLADQQAAHEKHHSHTHPQRAGHTCAAAAAARRCCTR